MGLVLSVYTQDAYKEYIMPALNNADYSIVLNKKFFQLKKDLEIYFEIIHDIWRIKPDDEYCILKEDTVASEILPLDDISTLTLLAEKDKKIILAFHSEDNYFGAYTKFDIRGINNITIGKNEDNMLQFDNQNRISRNHAEIICDGQNYYIKNKSQNGLYVNSRFIDGTKELEFGDYINILGLHIVFLGYYLAIDGNRADIYIHDSNFLPVKKDSLVTETDKSVDDTGGGKILYNRSPRIIEKIEDEPVEIEDPPKQMKSEKKPVLMTIGPSFTMAIPMMLGCLLMVYSSKMSGGSTSLFMYSGMVMAVSSALVGVVWAIVNLRFQKKTEIEKENHRFEAYSNYLLKKTDEIRHKYDHNLKALGSMYPAASECLEYDENTQTLWNRNISHEDFLSFRLGLGDIDFQAPIEVPKKRFMLEEDMLSDKPEFIFENYKILRNAPILVNLLDHRLIGIVGGEEKKGALDIARILVAQIASNVCYTDVKLVFIYDESNSDDSEQWEYAKWLPHVWSEDRKIRYIASNKQEAGEVFYELTKTLRQQAEMEGGKKKKLSLPYFIMFLSDPKLIEEELIARYVLDGKESTGLTTIMLTPRSELLPNACEFIIENDEYFKGDYDVSAQRDDRKEILFDTADRDELDQFARRLSNLEVQEMESGGEIPSTLTFFDMYGISKPKELKAEERWLKNRTYDNIKGMIGQKSGGAPCFMDVHEKYHGPHGLVAGTTGSGKSETLQTYMLSLAINYSPDDIGFFIIDYKGGGMAHLFDGLPHMIGQISNLSGNQVQRAMVSIKSENRRRQRIFNENGVNNINSYTKMYKNREATVPIPHLFIIIDEFAELKKEEPEFMKELISVAQVGRSLGVHLILATQKPSGTVDDNIWSNSRFRLCLRVQDRQDSNDMLHKPDAAYITQAGRCYLQVGSDEVYELFQSGWSGAPYDENIDMGKTEIARLLTLNGKAELTGGYARTIHREQLTYKWISDLIKCLEQAGLKKMNSQALYQISRIELQEIVESVYREMEKNQLDYPKSKYNSARLEEFINLYCSTKAMEGDTAENIIKLAAASSVKLPQAREKTQLDAVKDYLRKVAADNNYNNNHQLWMPVLPGYIYLDSFADYQQNQVSLQEGKWPEFNGSWSMDIPIGMIDDPQNQAQVPLHISFSEGGHHAIIGAVVSGKSTLMQTILYGLIHKYSPEYLNIYGLDFSSKMMSAFDGDAHFGGIMYEGDNEKIAKFFTMISNMLDERKKAFRGGNYSQYVQVHGLKYPAIIIAIDNFSAFKEKTHDAYEQMIVQLSKEGVGHGIYLLISAGGFGMNEIPNRIAENLKTVLCLEMADKYAYSDVLHTTQIQVLPESGIKGRGLALYGNRVLEYQAALALKAEDDYQRMESIAEECRKLTEAWTGRTARKIPEIPEKPTWETFEAVEEVREAFDTDHLIPVGYDSANADIYSIDMRSIYCYLIAGAIRTGKKNFMRIMIDSVSHKNSEITVIDGGSLMEQMRDQNDINYVQDEDALLKYFHETLTPQFKERNQRKNQLLAEGCEEEDLFEQMKEYKPVFIFITDMMWFMNTVYNSPHGMKGFMETLTLKGRCHNIYFIGNLDLENRSVIRGYQAFVNFSSYKTGIHFGGNISQNVFMNFDYLSYVEQNKVQKPGIGQIPEMNGDLTTQRIVVPLAGKRRKT